jgi:hypothetical protein
MHTQEWFICICTLGFLVILTVIDVPRTIIIMFARTRTRTWIVWLRFTRVPSSHERCIDVFCHTCRLVKSRYIHISPREKKRISIIISGLWNSEEKIRIYVFPPARKKRMELWEKNTYIRISPREKQKGAL